MSHINEHWVIEDTSGTIYYRRYLGSLGWEGIENEEYEIKWTVNGPQQELVDSYKEMLPALLERIQEEVQRGKAEIFVICEVICMQGGQQRCSVHLSVVVYI